MGRNGSGKSSLLWALHGAGPRQAGTVRFTDDGTSPHTTATAPSRGRAAHLFRGGRARADAERRRIGLVPQTPTDLLYLETVGAELAQAQRESGSHATLDARELLDRFAPGIPDAIHPRDLSEGQKLSLVLAIQLTAAPSVVLLDEPTRGLDYQAKRHLIQIVDALAAEGRSVVISTHDVEFVAAGADRVVVMAEGDVVADGPTADVIVASPSFAPQAAKILAPLPYLTVAQVADTLAGTGSGR
jgi:energy-coupling factor transport system ATP-binding protein